MGFMDEIKKLTHPYSDVEEDDYDDYDDEPLDNTPPAAPARDTRRSSSSASTAPRIRQPPASRPPLFLSCIREPPFVSGRHARDLRIQNVTVKYSARYSAMAAPAEHPA